MDSDLFAFRLSSVVLPYRAELETATETAIGYSKGRELDLGQPCLFVIKVYWDELLETLALARASRTQARKTEKRNLGFSQGTYRTSTQRTIQ